MHLSIHTWPRPELLRTILARMEQFEQSRDELGYNSGIEFDTFHMSIEEPDILYTAIRACKGRVIDVHTGDTNRTAAGDGSLDWPKILSTLREVGCDGALAFESAPPSDRTTLRQLDVKQLETNLSEMPES